MRPLALLLATFVLFAMSFPASSASAATPNNQACLGKDFSSYARDDGSGFGQFNAWLAQWVPGLGYPIQLHLAGQFHGRENSCDD